MGLSIWQILIIVLVIVLLFGSRKIPQLMRDMGQGLTAFKSGMGKKDEDQEAEAKTVEEAAPAVETHEAEEAGGGSSGGGGGRRKSSGGRKRSAAKT